jgi:ribosomal protein S27E
MPVACTAEPSGPRVGYERRQPEKSVLHRVVRENIETLFAEAEQRSEHGFGYPEYVKREFRRYLDCGCLARGFVRVKCKNCGFEHLVAHSCKSRAICNSCMGRRMADSAAHLVDHVLPIAPYRLWTLSLPKRIRLQVIRDPHLLSAVLAVFLRTLFAYQRRRARQRGIRNPLPGAITFVQFWGSILQITPHFHSWLPDGVFHVDEQGELSFQRLDPPTDNEVQQLLLRIEARILKVCGQKDVVPDDDEAAILTSQWEAMQPPLFTIPLTEHELVYRFS